MEYACNIFIVELIIIEDCKGFEEFLNPICQDFEHFSSSIFPALYSSIIVISIFLFC